jgi:competence protein ComEA
MDAKQSRVGHITTIVRRCALLGTVLLCSLGSAAWAAGEKPAATERPAALTQDKALPEKPAGDKLKDGASEARAVNINTADAATLAAALEGIGLKKAEAIVAHRETKGKFTSVEQLLDVKGIGQVTFEKNRDRIKI